MSVVIEELSTSGSPGKATTMVPPRLISCAPTAVATQRPAKRPNAHAKRPPAHRLDLALAASMAVSFGSSVDDIPGGRSRHDCSKVAMRLRGSQIERKVAGDGVARARLRERWR